LINYHAGRMPYYASLFLLLTEPSGLSTAFLKSQFTLHIFMTDNRNVLSHMPFAGIYSPS
jgi:hypothetical protein